MTEPPAKSAGAFRTIGEVAAELGVAQHVLRYWEGRFPRLRPLQRAGGRRYYRPDDVALARRIDGLLNREGYTVKGVQALLAREGAGSDTAAGDAAGVAALRAIRDRLADAIAADGR